ncbi:hypothetical protein [Nonomuraea lactucae]|uniref:hypothetical protein n=1 Tax=Nonomuraea lactucae TaxID=2249762 RepID=UPI000DE200B6|nr:hypothetical protein [Nonomuraea lactucae]
MIRRLVLVSLAAGALTVPAPASSAATELAIREINVRPAAPVVGPGDSVRLVIDVVARGAQGRNGVTIKVEPGEPPKSVDEAPARPWETSPAPATAPVKPAPVQQASAKPGPVDPMLVRPAPAKPAAKPAQAQPAPAAQDVRPLERPAPGGLRGLRELREMGPASWANQAARVASPYALEVTPATRRLQRGGLPMTEEWETWRFLPEKGLNRFHPAGTWTISATARDATGASVTKYTTFQLRRETRLRDVRVSGVPRVPGVPGPASVRLSGVLTRVGPRGYVDFTPFAEQPVEILWRAETSGTWEEVASTPTRDDGAFARTVPGRTGGEWRVRYPGTGQYAPVLSRIYQPA